VLLVAHAFDVLVALLAIGIVGYRYRGASVQIVPGDIILWTFTVFLVFPLFFDAADYVSVYKLYPELGEVSKDPLVSVVAASAVLVAAWIIARATRASATKPRPSYDPHVARWFWLLLSFLPLLVILGAPNPDVYRHFAAAIGEQGFGQPFYTGGSAPTAESSYQIYVTGSTYVSSIGLALWLLRRKSPKAFLLVPPIALMDFWIEGKRNIIALIAIQTVFALAGSRGLITRRAFYKGAIAALIVLAGVVGVAEWYEQTYRSTVTSKEVFKVDFGRTDVLRLAIAGQIEPGVPRPLEFIGQSVVLYPEQVLDRISHQRPISYEDRVTSIAIEEQIQPTHGAITTSILSEAIDNFGLLGILIGPIILGLLIRLAGGIGDPLLRLIVALFGALLIVTNLVATFPIIGLIFIRAIWVVLRAKQGDPPSEAERAPELLAHDAAVRAGDLSRVR
jgi:hypothetical protein